jgi:membrane protein
VLAEEDLIMFPPLRLREALSLGGLTLRELAARSWCKVNEHEILTRAAAVSFYAMLACVPFLALVLTVLVQLLPDITGQTPAEGVNHMTVEELRATLRHLFPREAYAVAEDQIGRLQDQMRRRPPIALLAGSVAMTLWLASSLYTAIIDAMNRIYGVTETRSFVRIRLTAMVMTIIQACILLGSLIAIVAGPEILAWFGFPSGTIVVAAALQWVVIVVMVLLSFALTFYIGPDADQKWEWVTPGSIAGSVVFLMFSFLFRLYVQHFANYNKTYGSLGGVMVLLFWFWVSSLVLLAAGQMNKVIEDASPLGKNFGQKRDPTDPPDFQVMEPVPVAESR